MIRGLSVRRLLVERRRGLVNPDFRQSGATGSLFTVRSANGIWQVALRENIIDECQKGLIETACWNVAVWYKRRSHSTRRECRHGSRPRDRESELGVQIALKVHSCVTLSRQTYILVVRCVVDSDNIEFVCSRQGSGAILFEICLHVTAFVRLVIVVANSDAVLVHSLRFVPNSAVPGVIFTRVSASLRLARWASLVYGIGETCDCPRSWRKLCPSPYRCRTWSWRVARLTDTSGCHVVCQGLVNVPKIIILSRLRGWHTSLTDSSVESS